MSGPIKKRGGITPGPRVPGHQPVPPLHAPRQALVGRVLTSHLAESDRPHLTLCGNEWEDWQAPMPTDEEINLRELPYGVRVQVKEEDRMRREHRGDFVRFCPACRKIMMRGGFAR